jgi:hypothetical protein
MNNVLFLHLEVLEDKKVIRVLNQKRNINNAYQVS